MGILINKNKIGIGTQLGALLNYLDMLNDGNTAAWYDSSDISTITKDGSDVVSRWDDKLGSGNDLTVGSATYTENGILFNGVTDYLKGSFNFNQPLTVYVLCRFKSHNNLGRLFSGSSSTSPFVAFRKGRLHAGAETTYLQGADMPIDEWGVVKFVFNGTSSKLRKNKNIEAEGNTGVSDMDAIVIASNSTVDSYFANVEIAEIILRKLEDNDTKENVLINYLLDRKSITEQTFDSGKLVISADDGKATQYSLLYPLLVNEGVSATLYIITDFIDTLGYLTWGQLLEMHNNGIDIQCHTTDHTQLPTLSEAQIIANLTQVNNDFDINNLPIPEHHAYPYGNFDNDSIDAVKQIRLTAREVWLNTDYVVWKNSGKYIIPSLVAQGLDAQGMLSLKEKIKYVNDKKAALTIYMHEIGEIAGSGIATTSDIKEIIDYAKSIGMDIITISELYSLMHKLNGVPSALQSTVISDSSIKLDWTIGSTDHTGHSIERSTDGITYAEVDTVSGDTATFTDTGLTQNTRYYYRVRAYNANGDYSSYCKSVNDWTAVSIQLNSTGDGSGVATMRLQFENDVVAILDGNGKFYSDSGGTANENTQHTFTADTFETIYLKVTSGTSNLLIFAKNNWKYWGKEAAGSDFGWLASTNAPSLSFVFDATLPLSLEKIIVDGSNTVSGSIANHVNLDYIRFGGTNTVSGSIANLTSLTYLSITGSNTISGSIANLTSLTYLRVGGSNTISGSIANLTSLTYFRVEGSNTMSGSIANLTLLNYVMITGSNTIEGEITNLTSLAFLSCTGGNTLSGSVSNLTALTYIYCAGANTISGDFGVNNASNGITTINLPVCAMVNYTSGATWSNAAVLINTSVGYGFSSTEIDNILIDMANSGTMSGKVITLQGASAARTSASDVAVATLEAAGCTINTN